MMPDVRRNSPDRLIRSLGSHIENILVKLGFTSRIQIATWHIERRKQIGSGTD